MGKCIHCGEKAGFLKNECKVCSDERENIKRENEQKEREKFIEELESYSSESIKEAKDFVENGIMNHEAKNDFPSLNFMKSEFPICSISGIAYFLEKTRTQYQGGSTGYSFRVVKGFWLRQSAFKGSPIKHDVLEMVDFPGEMVLTNKHIYWKGSKKAFRIKLEKLVHFTIHSNGIEFMRDTASARPEFIGYDEESHSINDKQKITMASTFDTFGEVFKILTK